MPLPARASLALLASLLLVACGRYGFDPVGGELVPMGFDPAVVPVAGSGPADVPASGADEPTPTAPAPPSCPEGLCRDPEWVVDEDLRFSLGFVGRAGANPIAERSDGGLLVLANAGPPSDLDYVILAFLEDGNPDLEFGESGVARIDTGGSEKAFSIDLLMDGRIMVSGQKDRAAQVLRLMPDGALDTSFGAGDGRVSVTTPGTTSTASNSITALSDGRYLIGGSSDLDFWASRLENDGSVDATFGNGGFVEDDYERGADFGRSYAMPDGRFLLAGTGRRFGFNYDCVVTRHLPDGSLDTSFGTAGFTHQDIDGGMDWCSAVAFLPGGGLLAGGSVGGIAPDGEPAVYRFDDDGTPASTYGEGGYTRFGLGGRGDVHSIARLRDGRFAAAGTVESGDGYIHAFLMLLDEDGEIDERLEPAFYDHSADHDEAFTALHVDRRGRLVVYGYANSDTESELILLRLVL